MKVLRWSGLGATAAAGLIAAGVAWGVGPWPGLARSVTAPAGELRYTAARAHGSTTVRAIRVGSGDVVASAKFAGAYGIPAVTMTGVAGGLSPDGRFLVLSAPPNFQSLRTRSRFLLISTRTLALRRTIVLKGDFGFDVLSPSGRTLYLIQHASGDDLTSYFVRAYDIRARRLLRGAIVDKGEPDEKMGGYPIARAAAQGGAWVYTLYHRGDDKPFVHALNTVKRHARCIDLPWQGRLDDVWKARLELSTDGRRLVVRSGSGATAATVDTKTFRVQ